MILALFGDIFYSLTAEVFIYLIKFVWKLYLFVWSFLALLDFLFAMQGVCTLLFTKNHSCDLSRSLLLLSLSAFKWPCICKRTSINTVKIHI